MNTTPNPSKHSKINIDDTYLDCHDSGGTGRPIIFLNGAYSSQRAWKKVVRQLGPEYRVITYDERARGKSGKSADYSFESCVKDLDAIIKATNAQNPILIGWSLGAAIAVRYAAEHPKQISGIVNVDGAYPISMLSDADKKQARQMFKKMAPILPLLALLGKAARMSADQAADFNIELDEVLGKLNASYDKLTCSALFICASKRSMGGTEAQFQKMRASVEPLVRQNQNVSVFKTLPCNHLEILSKYPDTVVAAVRALDIKA